MISLKQILKNSISSLINNVILNNDNIRRNLWHITNKRPGNELVNLTYLPNDIQKEMYRIATLKSAQFLMNNHPEAKPFLDEESLLSSSVEKSQSMNLNGLYLEFGVFSGRTINIIAEKVQNIGIIVHGFDSFEGLPEDWNETAQKGMFNVNGKLPAVNNNVRLYKGWFSDSLPEFLKTYQEKVSFIHIDSDLYSSAKTVLTLLKDRIRSGTIIQFDEFLNYPTFEQHEYKAFFEFIEETGFKYSCIGYDTSGFSVSFIIE